MRNYIVNWISMTLRAAYGTTGQLFRPYSVSSAVYTVISPTRDLTSVQSRVEPKLPQNQTSHISDAKLTMPRRKFLPDFLVMVIQFTNIFRLFQQFKVKGKKSIIYNNDKKRINKINHVSALIGNYQKESRDNSSEQINSSTFIAREESVA